MATRRASEVYGHSGTGALGALGAEAAAATRVVPEGAIVGVALASGLALGVSTVVLAQRLRTPKSNLQLLREDLGGLLGIVRQWLFYGFWSTFHSRLASGDARVSFGAAHYHPMRLSVPVCSARHGCFRTRCTL